MFNVDFNDLCCNEFANCAWNYIKPQTVMWVINNEQSMQKFNVYDVFTFPNN